MADISQEINNFQNAIYGEEVRGSMISLAEKLNQEVENNTQNTTVMIGRAQAALDNANESVDKATVATKNANQAVQIAENTRQDMLNRVASGEFNGEKGEQGEQGPQGESGVMAPSAGMFSLYLDPATGNLYADYPDGENPPAFEYDSESGDLYYITG